MPSFQDSIFLFVLALLLFGPKRLPILAREIGKWVGEFRRASNEFKMQMEEELRLSEQSDRQKQIAAIEAAAPIPPSLDQPEHPHIPAATADDSDPYFSTETTSDSSTDWHDDASASSHPGAFEGSASDSAASPAPQIPTDAGQVLPIATSGDLRMMPPSTGLPTPRQPAPRSTGDPLGGLLDAIPESRLESRPESRPESRHETEAPSLSQTEPETAAHGH
jgi:sec-independent protein translocase protein TatB